MTRTVAMSVIRQKPGILGVHEYGNVIHVTVVLRKRCRMRSVQNQFVMMTYRNVGRENEVRRMSLQRLEGNYDRNVRGLSTIQRTGRLMSHGPSEILIQYGKLVLRK